MSKEAFVDFYENHLNSDAGEAVKNQLNSVKNGDEFLALATKSGKAAGFDFSKSEVQEVMRASEAQMAKSLAEASGEALSDEELASIAGGASFLSSDLTKVKINTMPTYLDKGDLQFSTVMCPW